ALRVASRYDVRNVLRDGFNLGGTDANHFFVIERFVVNVARDVLFFEAADAMLEAGSAGDGPGARERFWIAAIRLEVDRVGGEIHRDRGNFVEVGDFPGLGAVGEVAVGKNDDRNHVFHGNARSFKSGPEAITGGGGRDDRDGSFGVAAEKRLEQVG